MIKIEEVPIPRDKKPIFIDYSKICENPRKRLLFLRALIKTIDSKEAIIHYEDLGLSSEDVDLFKKYLNERYQGKCRIHKKILNMDDFDGKIICNIDLLIEDIFEILSQSQNEDKLTDQTAEKKDPASLKIETQINYHDDKNRLNAKLRDSSNKYLREIFHIGISLAETQLFVNKVFKETKPENLEAIFNFSSISEEINKIPLKIRNKECDVENVVSLRRIILKILNKFETQLTNKQYWKKLSVEINTLFSKIIDQCNQEKFELCYENGTRNQVTVNEIILNENINIFFAEPGKPDINNRNAVISRYNNKIAVFNFKYELSGKIQPNDIVLAEIDEITETFVKVNPLKILKKEEALKLIKVGMDVFPSSDFILENTK